MKILSFLCLVCILILEGISGYFPTSEETQADLYFRTLRKFNETGNFLRYEQCQNPEYAIVTPCYRNVSNDFLASSRLWTPKTDSNVFNIEHKKQDCEYTFAFLGNRRYESESLEFSEHLYLIKQSKCSALFLEGGTTFNIYSTNTNYHIRCSVEDLLNNDYVVSCPMPCLYDKDSCLDKRTVGGTAGDCREVTVLLEYEHFDSYMDSIHDIITSASYPPLRRLLVDNQTFCSGKITESKANIKLLHGYLDKREARSEQRVKQTTPGVTLYSGVWVNKALDRFPESASAALNRALQPTLVPRRSTYDFAAERSTPELKGLLPTVTAMEPTSVVDHSSKYVFRSLSSRNAVTSVRNVGNDSLYSALFHLNSSSSTEMQYVFHGASHSRFNFDYVVQSYLEDLPSTLTRKHAEAHIGNLHHYHPEFVFRFIEMLDNECREWDEARAKGDKKPITLILQTGAWDATQSSARLFLRHYGPKLLNQLESILNGTQSCGNVVHMIVVSVPAPPHGYIDARTNSIAQSIAYRNNGAVQAFNSMVMNRLLGSRINPRIKLSLVDAYAMQAPRLLFHPDIELVGITHYIYRYSQPVVYTPAGKAVIDSILAALLDYEQTRKR